MEDGLRIYVQAKRLDGTLYTLGYVGKEVLYSREHGVPYIQKAISLIKFAPCL